MSTTDMHAWPNTWVDSLAGRPSAVKVLNIVDSSAEVQQLTLVDFNLLLSEILMHLLRLAVTTAVDVTR